jgi:predicted MPP superfamily phosphohydrolase
MRHNTEAGSRGRTRGTARGARKAQPAPSSRRFFGLFALWLATCWGIVGALLAPIVPGGWPAVLLAAVLSTLPLFALVGECRAGRYPGRLFRLLVMRPFWYVQLLLPLAAATGLSGAIAGAFFGWPVEAGRVALLTMVTLFVVVMTFGWAGSRDLVVKRMLATWPELPPGLDGLRIVQISDTHVGPHTSKAHLARVAAAVRNAQADLIAVTGDLVDDHARDVDAYAAALGRLEAPLGVFVVPGNHDVYAGWQEVRARLEALPVTVLVNSAAILRRGGDHFAVVGTGDPAGRRGGKKENAAPDVPAALDSVPPGMFVIALAHNPALWPALARHRVPLTLSGHTHWGQFALPTLGWSLASPFLEHAMGIHRDGRSLLYIHPGTNFWGIPFRLGTPPEVAVITLKQAPSPTMRRE